MQVRAAFGLAAVMILHFLPAEPEVDGLICLAACQLGLRGGSVLTGLLICCLIHHSVMRETTQTTTRRQQIYSHLHLKCDEMTC